MELRGLNHLAFITDDMTKTVRFYRDLLGMTLHAGVGHDGYRHYFFQMGQGQVAFFEYDGAVPMERGKFHGERTDKPLGFDHVAFTVESKEALFQLKDKLDAAGIETHGVVDHGIIWSVYFFDPNNIPLEACWDCMEIRQTPAIFDTDPLPVAAEGAAPQPGHWPEVSRPTQPADMRALPGNGHVMRDDFINRGVAVAMPDLPHDSQQREQASTAAE